MTTALLGLFCLLSVLVYFRAEARGFRSLVYASRVLALVSVALVAQYAWPAVPGSYRILILVGLGLSLAGDLLLLLPSDRFLSGLTAFLGAHVLYGAAFFGRLDALPVLPFLPYAITLAFVLRLLWPQLGSLRLPVILYGSALAAMAGLALAVAVVQGGTAWLAAAGAGVFVVSDAALAFDRFVGHFEAAPAVVLGTYYPAQFLIALSVLA